MSNIIKFIYCSFCTVFVLDTLDDKIYICFKLELQAPVVSFEQPGPVVFFSFIKPYLARKNIFHYFISFIQ